MATRKYPIPPKEIIPEGFTEEDCEVDMEGELKSALNDFDKEKVENKDLKKDLNDANACIKKLSEKIKKSTKRVKETNE